MLQRCRLLEYYRKKLKGIDESYVPGPTSTATDNKGAHDLSYNPEFHKRAKHIKRRHFYVRDMVESGEIIVPLVRTDANAADFFTKPMPPEKFFKFRDVIMNIKKSPLSEVDPHAACICQVNLFAMLNAATLW